MLELHAAYPRAIAFDDLVARACARIYTEGDLATSKVILTREADVVGINLLQGHTSDSSLIDLHAHAPALAPTANPGERPATASQRPTRVST